MDLTLQNLLDFDFKSEIDSVIDSRPELGLNVKELSPLDLDDDPFGCCGTELYGCFGSPTCLHGMSGGSNSQFDLDLNYYDSVFVDPKLVIPSYSPIPSDNITSVEDGCIEWQFEVPEIAFEEELYFKTEPASPEDSIFSDYETYANAQHTELQVDGLQNFENDVQTYIVSADVPQNSENDGNVQTHSDAQQLTVAAEAESNEKSYPKPAYSYTCLCALALKNSQSGNLLVTQIYSFIRKHFPYFKTAAKGWKNSVRHNLSHNKTFEKVETTTAGCPNKRSNLWFIQPAKVAKMDEELRKKSLKHSQEIKESMRHPEHLELLVRGEMKFGSSQDGDEDDDLSDYLVFPAAKRQKTLEGATQAVYVYEPAKGRKTPLACLATNAEE